MSGKIEILLHNQLLEVDLDDLKGNDDALIGILSQDSTNYRLFLEFAFEYYKRGMIPEFEKFLLAGKSQATNRNLNKEKHLLLLNTLAAFYIESAKKLKENETMPSVNSSEPRTAIMLLNQSLEILNEAEKISRTDKFTYVGKANIISLSQKSKDLDKVFANYKSALNIDPNFIPALIGLAGVHFQRKNFKAALSFYQKILTIQPDITPDVRMPIGICFYKLDMEDEAIMAFQRVLELDPKNSNAVLMLSLIELNKSKSLDISPADKKLHIKSSGARVLKAFQIDPRNGLCTSQLALRFLDKDSRKAGVMASSSLLYTTQPSILAEGYFLKGVISQKEVCLYFTKGDYKEALKNFKEAVTLQPKTPLFQFHLAQCHTQSGEIEDAIKCLEAILVIDSQDYDSLKVLYSLRQLLFNLYATNPSHSDKAAAQLETIAKMIAKKNRREIKTPNIIEEITIKDPELLIDVAEYLEKTNIFAARKKYLEFHAILEKKGQDIPPELLNNIAVLYHIEADSINSFYQGQYQVNCKISPEDTTEAHLNEALDNAQNLYEQALTKLAESDFLEDKENAERVTALQTTIRFNVSRLYEAKGETEKAELNYKELLKVLPAFGDCLLRLGAIEQNRGDTDKALDYYSDALAIDSRNADAWFMIGNIYKKIKNYRAARKSFEKVLMNEKYNTYALCSAGNLCLVFARGDRDDESRKLHFTRSIEYFCKVLSLQPTNLHAAAGIGIAYAETGKFAESRDVFNHIQELTAGDTRMALNTGHVLVELGQYHQAVTLYESILKKGGLKNDVVVLHSLSRVHFIIAKTTKSSESMKTARLYIQKAIHANPSDKSLLFNLALIEQQTGQVLNEQTSESRSVDELREALKDIDLSEKLFKFLASLPPSPALKYDPLRAKERGTFCAAVRKSAEKNIHQSEVMKRQREERLNEIKERKLQAELEAKRKEEAERLEREAKEAELAAKRKELFLKMQEDNEKSRLSKRGADDSDDEEGKAPKSKRKKKQAIISEDDEPSRKSKRIVDSDDD